MILAKIRAEVRGLRADLLDCYMLVNQIRERIDHMSQKVDELKALVADIGNDVTEIDGDIQKVLDKIAEFGDAPTATEMAELTTMLSDLKTRTRAAADKVPPA